MCQHQTVCYTKGGGCPWQAGSEVGEIDTTLTEGLVRSQWAALHSLTMRVSNTGAIGHSKDKSVSEMDQLLHGIAWD